MPSPASFVYTSVAEAIRAQEAMLAVLCGAVRCCAVLCGVAHEGEEVVAPQTNWDAGMDEVDGDDKTPRQIAETRAAWREAEADRARPWDGTRGRGRGRGG